MPTKPKPRALPKGRVMFTTEDFEAWGFTKNAGIFISLPHFPCAVIPCATCEALRKELAEAKAANTRLERDKARYDFCKRQMFVSTHGIAPGVTALFMPPLPVDGVMGYADEIVDRAMMPGTAANVAALTDAAQSSPEAQGKAGT